VFIVCSALVLFFLLFFLYINIKNK
jgi:hypothetical protein